jgi:galactonate dehydratase
MKLAQIETFAVQAPRDVTAARGGAGSPAALQPGSARYALAATYGTVYSRDIETLIVKVTTTDGMVGWGEAQAPVAPEAAQEIIQVLIAPLVLAQEVTSPPAVRQMLYDAMRVRGHTGGFYIDAVSAVDIALWDLEAKAVGVPLHRLLGGSNHKSLPVYISGLAGTTQQEQLESLETHLDGGATAIKVFMAQEPRDCLSLVQEIRRRSAVKIFVDALWRLNRQSALRFARELDACNVGWLEAPLAPEDVAGHRDLARLSPIRIAVGESYRTSYEIMPFLEARAVQVLQPDIGRCGVTEGNHMASLARSFHISMAPHISIGLGPQIAAAIQCSASWSNLEYVECNPQIYIIAERFQTENLGFSSTAVEVADRPGLGIEMNEKELRKFSRVQCTRD